ncbi:bifunctional adenosylcobinamide kinase/adenosylcobinamide-phosphate guanylyltransferase [Neptunomonas qingdaonensis]|uniref:Bifunctional adenosylcobalamin biosynthesis protein n=1 Tax=Neptunomonas qingdaonensis TaxID=1045558 RepID=A0A1I2W458_9GAMM|nr:bifunctional adenosylcobinamide kinase/adenosylcobinamide-phosphate guanylyltransferase [Neptunomonas qingdaonensis]SFG96082.1 adenosylcobinamide kinase /adenosylcobinamide-phosphate guanylyltransferase [Neptunomonas qingdaonensis]
MIRFILGGARSGKSRYAEQLASASGKEVIYIATAQAYDDEMKARILQHKKQRPQEWRCIEESMNIDQVLSDNSSVTNCILIDCLTLWLTNLLCENCDVTTAKQVFMEVLRQSESDIILVSNETGMGVVPMGELTRRYCDEGGWLHQDIAALADEVVLMVAGIPLVIKGPPSY